jgi:hypothetical protein
VTESATSKATLARRSATWRAAPRAGLPVTGQTERPAEWELDPGDPRRADGGGELRDHRQRHRRDAAGFDDLLDQSDRPAVDRLNGYQHGGVRRFFCRHENVHFYATHSADVDGELAKLDADGYRLLRSATAEARPAPKLSPAMSPPPTPQHDRRPPVGDTHGRLQLIVVFAPVREAGGGVGQVDDGVPGRVEGSSAKVHQSGLMLTAQRQCPCCLVRAVAGAGVGAGLTSLRDPAPGPAPGAAPAPAVA